jgi:cobalt-zinc-cadmium resistance protein CzcA
MQLPIDAVPDITNVQVQVLTNVPALGPVDVERTITFPVESSMSGLPGVEEIRSVSRFGLSAVTSSSRRAPTCCARGSSSPSGSFRRASVFPRVLSPELGPLSSGLGEIFQFEVRADNMCPAGQPDTEQCYTPMELRSVLDWFVAYELRSCPASSRSTRSAAS